MFSTSTQRKYWIFENDSKLISLRMNANQLYVNSNPYRISESELSEFYLTYKEECSMIKYYEHLLKEFCRKFQPTMPPTVIGTAVQYFKRFYLNNTVMDYHPKHIMVTCVYLACKVEEFNVTMQQFVMNTRGDRNRASDIVLNNELLLMQQLKYQLTTHNPFRAIQGFLIDIKTRYPNIGDLERFRPHIDSFIDKSYFTDACLLYSPSQIALAAVIYAAKECNENLDKYLTEILLADLADANENIENLQSILEAIQNMTKNQIDKPAKDEWKRIEKKLEKCINQNNNPDSNEYRNT